MTMVAEGVEDEYTANQLVLFHCDKLQGFLFSKALPGPEFGPWMDAHESAAASFPRGMTSVIGIVP